MIQALQELNELRLICLFACLGCAGLPAILGLGALVAQVRDRVPYDNFYNDLDGKATPETTAEFSNTFPKRLLLISSTTGLVTSLASNILQLIAHGSSCETEVIVTSFLVSALWLPLLLQACAIFALHSPNKCYGLGIWIFFPAALCCVAATAELLSSEFSNLWGFDLSMRIGQFISYVVFLIACISLPRRPNIVFDGKIVDGEQTVSALDRYTWRWANPLLRLAHLKGDLTLEDIPCLPSVLRARSLLLDWQKVAYQGSLLWSLFREYRRALALQILITAIRTVLGLGPYWSMFRIVRVLEENPTSRLTNVELWLLVFVLGVSGLLERWLESLSLWYGVSRISLPLRGQLSSLVYAKSLRRKNTKCPDNDTTKHHSVESDDKTSADQQSRQATVNLVGVDARRVADFAISQTFLFAAIGKILINSLYLLQVVGSTPFFVGLSVWFIVLPANSFISRRYARAEERLMKARDRKLSVINEALQGIRQIKFAAMEQEWLSKILTVRSAELSNLTSVLVSNSILCILWFASPILLTSACLFTYVIQNGSLPASVAFVSVGIFKSLEAALSVIPDATASGLDTWISLQRIQSYLNSAEMEDYLSAGTDIVFKNATIAWTIEKDASRMREFTLKNMDLAFPKGELSLVSGPTGSGKSLLLNAIIGEADLLSGVVQVPETGQSEHRHDFTTVNPGNWVIAGSMAFVGQSPWLETASLRDNILFDLPYMEARYKKTIEACAMNQDLEALLDGDRTQLGFNGVNLSGGQKWRLTLARAVYSRAEILILDDIFSAVDASMGRHILEHCIAGELCRKRTRILVTHHPELVASQATYHVKLRDGKVIPSALTSEDRTTGYPQDLRINESSPLQGDNQLQTAVDGDQVRNTNHNTVVKALQVDKSKSSKPFIVAETHEIGKVDFRVYSSYIAASGGTISWFALVIIYLSFEMSVLGQNWWLRHWTSQSPSVDGALQYSPYSIDSTSMFGTTHLNQFTLNRPGESSEALVIYYLGIYMALSCISVLLTSLRVPISFYLGLRASKTLFEQVISTVVHMDLRWLDTVPMGRILNRLSADFEIIDNHLISDVTLMLRKLLPLLTICAAGILTSYYILPMAIIMLSIAWFIVTIFMRGARPMRRLDSVTKSPVFEFFHISLSGLSTLRVFHKSKLYTDQMCKLLDAWNAASMYNWVLNRWMAFRMALISQVFSTALAAIVVASSDIDASMAGFALFFALEFSSSMITATRAYASVELDMNATERIVEYMGLQTEELSGEEPPTAWPASGEISIKNLTVTYDEGLPPALENVSLSIKDGERIGIVGRSGAGKSSLILALFQLIHISSGSIHVDGVDISRLRLASLRSRLAVIPQDPMLYSGTLRSNLDPFGEHSDNDLLECLSKFAFTDMSDSVTSQNIPEIQNNAFNYFRNLDSPIAEGGGNLSQGQRQLLCIARCILSRPKIIILDEATSAVDTATDKFIQQTIRKEFRESTVLVVAHRLSTIADFDRVLVLDSGHVVEFDTPKKLWNQGNSLFRKMCEQSGDRDHLLDLILNSGSYEV